MNKASTAGSPPRQWPRLRPAEAILYFSAAFAAFAFSGTRALFGSENRWAEVVREIFISGDIFHPCINNAVYFDKPILSYWLIALSAKLFGELNEWTLRLPSALFSVIAVWAAVKVFSRLADRRSGILSGWLLLSSFGFLWWSRSAEADMENMTVILLAFAWFIRCRERAGFFQYLVFYLIVFIGALFKGLPAVAVPLAAAGIFAIMNGEVRRHLKFSNFAALAIGITAFFVTPYLAGATPLPQGCVYAENLSALELMWRENVVRAFNAFDHKGGWYIYFYELPRVLAPWSPLFLLALIWAFTGWKKLSRELRALAVINVAIFIIFSLSQSRRWYYILPITPFAAGLTAIWLSLRDEELKWLRPVWNVVRYAAITAASLAILSPLGWPLYDRIFKFELHPLIIFSIPAIGLVMIVLLIIDERSRDKMAAFFMLPAALCGPLLAVAAAMIGFFTCILPGTDSFRTTRRFLLETRPLLGEFQPGQVVAYLHEPSCDLLYYWNFPPPMNVVTQKIDAAAKPDRARQAQASLDELGKTLRAVTASGKPALLVSQSRAMNKLNAFHIREIPEFNRADPDRWEPDFELERKNDQKFRIWIIHPESVAPNSGTTPTGDDK
ncbi:MAG: glycosyltransferase family 39 protein [Victivallaceae bacterium]|nr:glycosyltransferase family 39 protein [Victivallaceae bacterium]